MLEIQSPTSCLIHTYLGRVAGQCRPDAHRVVLSRASLGAGLKALVQNMCGFVSPWVVEFHQGRILSRRSRSPRLPRPHVLW